ncbi:hypothetical protein HFO28_13800 [Rhizobium leguminosarum]|uniref:hypothetical protein n=1 Tax=Rhizobium leguminosarum TaxID=384 RepID=UPI001C96C040|nr:hypothetical protein [Rhizobium leguminosarum]MBY5744654.1 hypothetical protein [Rhizobium leguminosarum]
MKVIALFAFAILLPAETCGAQELCTEVLRYAARDVTLDVQENTVGRIMYDNFCQGRQLKENVATDGSASFPIEGIPVKFTGAASGNKDKVSNLCRSFGEKIEEDSSRYEYTNLASNAAISAWKDCMLFAKNQKVTVRPMVTLAYAIINVEKIGPDPVTITKIIASPGLRCEADSGTVNVSMKPISEFTTKTLQNADQWQVICERNGVAQPDGGKLISHADIGIATSKGTFLFPVPPDTILGPATATELRSEINSVQNAGKTTAETLNGMVSWTGEDNRGKCLKVDMVQICYGSIATSFPGDIVGANGAMRVINIKFPKPFAAPPIITSSFGPKGAVLANADTMAIAAKMNVTNEGALFYLHDKLHINFAAPLDFDYLAIGPYQ